MNVIARLEYELAYYDSTVHRFNHYTTRTPLKEQVILSRLRIGHTRTTHSYQLKTKQQPTCHACQTKYIVKHILIECTNLAHIRETFSNTNNMKELFRNIETRNVMSFLKAINKYAKTKKKFQQNQIFLQTAPLQEILQQNLILSTNCFKKSFLLPDDSLHINFQQNHILSTDHFPTNKFQHNRSFRFPDFFNLIWH